MANSIHRVFWVGAILSFLALAVTFLLPAEVEKREEFQQPSADCGETMFMAEQTTINTRNQPQA